MLVDRARDYEVGIDNLPEGAGERAALLRRLNRLEDMRLAERLAADRCRFDRELEGKLVRMGEAGERERATARLLAKGDRGLERDRIRELELAHSSRRAMGRLVGYERMGSGKGAPYLLGIEGVDGRFWTARVAREEELRLLNGVERGAVLEIRRGARGAADAKAHVSSYATAIRFRLRNVIAVPPYSTQSAKAAWISASCVMQALAENFSKVGRSGKRPCATWDLVPIAPTASP